MSGSFSNRSTRSSRARNAGAAVATGNWYVFVDADTLVSRDTLTELLAVIESGDVAGGASVLRFDNPDITGRVFVAVSNAIIRPLKFTCGCFQFCRADAFRALGGFDEQLFAGEDADLGKRLKRWAGRQGLRLAILHRSPPVTSFRKIELYGWGKAFLLITRWLLLPESTMRDKSQLHMFYDGRR